MIDPKEFKNSRLFIKRKKPCRSRNKAGKKLKKPDLHFGQENCSKARYLEHLSNLLSSVTLKRVSFIKPFTHSVNWQREQLSEMNRSHANPFFSVPLIGSLIYCHRTLQEGEACVGGWVQRERERTVDFWDLMHFGSGAYLLLNFIRV